MPFSWPKFLQLSARIMSMDDETWKRHANPLSVYSRMTVLPLLTMAIVSRIWIGWWALALILVVLAWTWWNPRAFPPPRNRSSWAARGTFGERVLLNHAAMPVPAHHIAWARLLAACSAFGIPPWLYGLWQYDVGYMLFGLTLMMGGKLWFVDRMVWLYADMKRLHPPYRDW